MNTESVIEKLLEKTTDALLQRVNTQPGLRHEEIKELGQVLAQTIINMAQTFQNSIVTDLTTGQEQLQQKTTAKSTDSLALLRQNPHLSIQRKKIVCLECGLKFRQLSKKHLEYHGLTPTTYKAKWGLPKRQSLVAKELSLKRKEHAQRLGNLKQNKKTIEKLTESSETIQPQIRTSNI